MAVRGSRGAQRNRTNAERARVYAARRQWHEGQAARRRRDTVVAVVAGALVVVGAVISQTVHAQVTAPEPSHSAPASAPPVTPSPIGSPTPTQTPGE